MGIYDSLKVTASWHIRYFYSLMKQDIVKEKVTKPISRHPHTYPGKNKQTFAITYIDKKNRYADEKQGEYIIFLEAVPGVPVVIFVQDPEKTVHNIFMHKPCYPFHPKKCDKNNQEIKGVNRDLYHRHWSLKIFA
jgi:hypothetical protein